MSNNLVPLSVQQYRSAPPSTIFSLITAVEQAELCRRLGLPFQLPFSRAAGECPLPVVQESVAFVPYDGNCLFSSFCRNLTGVCTDEGTGRIRSLICQALHNYQCWLFPFDSYTSAAHYIVDKEMFRDGVWGGDLEILALVFLTGCKVYVKHSYLGWIVYDTPFTNSRPCLFLLLKNDHYQPIDGFENELPLCRKQLCKPIQLCVKV